MLYSGGGIAGLCLSVSLAKYRDIELNVYEAAATFKEVGAGVMMWGRVWRVLSLLGMADAFRELAGDTKDGDTSKYALCITLAGQRVNLAFDRASIFL